MFGNCDDEKWMSSNLCWEWVKRLVCIHWRLHCNGNEDDVRLDIFYLSRTSSLSWRHKTMAFSFSILFSRAFINRYSYNLLYYSIFYFYNGEFNHMMLTHRMCANVLFTYIRIFYEWNQLYCYIPGMKQNI